MLHVLRLSLVICIFSFLAPTPGSSQVSPDAPRVTIQSGGWGTAIRSQAGKDTTFTGKDGASVVTASGLQEALRWGNVTVISEGDIVVDASLTWSSNSRLTLNARRSIVVRKGATVASKRSAARPDNRPTALTVRLPS